MRMLAFLVAMLGVAVPRSPVIRLGDEGHRIICEIAYRELNPEIKARIDALVAYFTRTQTAISAARRTVISADHPANGIFIPRRNTGMRNFTQVGQRFL